MASSLMRCIIWHRINNRVPPFEPPFFHLFTRITAVHKLHVPEQVTVTPILKAEAQIRIIRKLLSIKAL